MQKQKGYKEKTIYIYDIITFNYSFAKIFIKIIFILEDYMAKPKKMTYGIIGLGRFGTALAYKLNDLGADILVIDKDEEKVSEFREITDNAFISKSITKKGLLDMGVQDCDVVIVCIASSIDVSILTVMKLFSIGVKRVVAKVTSLEHAEILQKLGAEIVFPEQDMAIRLANRLEMGAGLDFIELSESINITKVKAPTQFVGKSIKDANIRGKFGLNIIAIENGGNVIDLINPDYVFDENDILYFSGNKIAIHNMLDWIDSNGKNRED